MISFKKSDWTEIEAGKKKQYTASLLAPESSTDCLCESEAVCEMQRRDPSVLQVYSFPSLFATLHAGHVW